MGDHCPIIYQEAILTKARVNFAIWGAGLTDHDSTLQPKQPPSLRPSYACPKIILCGQKAQIEYF